MGIGPGPFRGQPAPGRRRFPPRRPVFFGGAYYPSYFGYPYAYPYSGYPPDYESSADYQPGDEGYAGAPDQEDPLLGQVEQLTSEVDQLRAAERPPVSAPSAESTAPEPKPIPTVFVYHDGRQLEAENYAILGQTLWVFGDQTTRKIALADLDLNVSKKLNDQRGVDFSLPGLQ